MRENLKMPPLMELVIELGVVRMRVGVGRLAAETYRPRMCLLVDQSSGVILHFELGEPAPSYLPLVLKSLGQVVERIGGLPKQIQLRDTRLASALRDALKPAGVEVVVRESLPKLDEAVEGLMDFKKISGKPEPGLLDVKGITLDHVMAFADAAKVFYEARPWRHLSDDDLIAVESPHGPPGTQFLQVLGAGGQAFGLGFVASRKVHEDIRDTGAVPRGGLWSLAFGDIDSIPFEDGETWERHHLTVAGPQAYPTFLKLSKSKSPGFPTPEHLVWAEGLLRAIAATTEEQLDRGRWSVPVETFSGPRTYEFSLPLLLEQMEGRMTPNPSASLDSGRRQLEKMMRAISQKAAQHGNMSAEELNEFTASLDPNEIEFTPTTDAERAQVIVDKAREARGRRQIQLAREALKIDPNSAEALLLLAERAGDPESAIPLYRQAVEAGERQLGPDQFQEAVGHFWGILQTRPYMRARQQLAVSLLEQGDTKEAIGHLQELLRLNPGDNQGNRYLLADALLAANDLDSLDELLNRPEYKDEASAEWAFTRALLVFRRHGPAPESIAQLETAMKENPFVVPLLTGRMEMPPFTPPYSSPGSAEEGVAYVIASGGEWEESSGAIEWLEEVLDASRKRAKKAKPPSGKKKKPR